jgi:hypothetical protein
VHGLSISESLQKASSENVYYLYYH